MDFGRNNSSSIAIRNPAAGHSPYVDEKAGDWADTEADILSYLSDVTKLEAMADKAANAEQLALVLEPFLDNAETYLEALGKIADGQVTWTEIRKKFGSKVGNAIAKIRKLNAEFGSEMEQLDAKDRAAMLKIETKRQHGLAEIASELTGDLQAELWRHENKMEAIANRGEVAEKRQTIQESLRERRQKLLSRATVGSDKGIQEKIPVTIGKASLSNSVSATGTARGFGGWDGERNELQQPLSKRGLMHEFIGASPLSFSGGGQQKQQQQQQYQQVTAPTIDQPPPEETNAERQYRDAANLCEVVAPTVLGSAVVFMFHSMQVAGGSVVAIGIYQIYLAAKITGQSKHRLPTAIVGAGVSIGMLASLAEPLLESQQVSDAEPRLETSIKEIQTVKKPASNSFDYLPSIALVILVFCLIFKVKGGNK
jgi:hypothetical protein